MDLVADYARTYGGAPRHDQPWHEVLALLSRTARFEMRDRLIVADGTVLGQPVAESERAQTQLLKAKLRDIAYPGENV